MGICLRWMLLGVFATGSAVAFSDEVDALAAI